FFKEQLLEPKEVGSTLRKGEKVSIPSSFKELTGEVNTYGTFTKTVHIPPKLVGETLAIHIPYEYSAYELFVDGARVTGNGSVATNGVAHEAEMAPRVGYFIAQSEAIELVMQVSSFNHIRGGF